MKLALLSLVSLCLFSFITPSAHAATAFSHDLSLNGAQSSADVRALQQFLISQGVYAGEVTGTFYIQTYKAVVAFQKKQGIVPASGFWGPSTRAIANSLIGATATTGAGTSVATTVSVDSVYAQLEAQLAAVWVQLRNLQDLFARSRYERTTATDTTTKSTTTTAAATAKATTTSSSSSTQSSSTASRRSASTTTTTTTTTVPAATPAAPVAGGVKWGAYLPDGSSLSSLETLVGKQASFLAVFTSFDDSFPSSYKSSLCSSGKTLVIFWESYGHSLDGIIAGKDDAYLRSFSQAAASYGCPVILAPFHEMNGNWDDWDGTVGNNSPAKLISAWRHMHDLVTAGNVKWAWAVNSDSVPDTAANAIGVYYPGSSYVDYVAVDGFNFGSPWQSFSSVFSSALTQLKTYGKPIYILSMASASGSQKAAWITDALTVQIPKHGIAGWIWFNEKKEQNWLVNSDTAALAAFKAGI